MNLLGMLLLAVVAVLALLLPWTEWGALCIHLVCPAALGFLCARLFPDRGIFTRVIVAHGLVGLVAGVRICWTAMVREGGDWSFDGELDLLLVSVALQLFFGGAGFAAGLIPFAKRVPA